MNAKIIIGIPLIVVLILVSMWIGNCYGPGPGGDSGDNGDKTKVVEHPDVKPPSMPDSKVSEDQQVIVISGEGYEYLIDGQQVGGYKNLEREIKKHSGSLFDLSAFRERRQTHEKISKLVKQYNGKIIK
ncbi:MAG: hypothetical protein IKO72_03810 [Kiritimatiellae bacterium]|nr:hypothetical protein [Kiritimatiellia bacterium]